MGHTRALELAVEYVNDMAAIRNPVELLKAARPENHDGIDADGGRSTLAALPNLAPSATVAPSGEEAPTLPSAQTQLLSRLAHSN